MTSLPAAWSFSMYWWAAAMSSRLKTRSMLGRQTPASTWRMIRCSTAAPALPLRLSLWKAVSLVPDGIIATGSKSGIAHPLSEPVTHTVPPRRTRRSESASVLAPTRSRT
jgi:hypothetical protein